MAKNNKTRFIYVSYSGKTWIFDQSERGQGLIYIINFDICESSGSKFAMNIGDLLGPTATTKGFLFVKYQGQSSLEQRF